MTIHPIKGYIQTSYLIEYPDKLLLFDAGCSCDYKLILAEIEKLNRRKEELKLIAVSHMHPDHCGGAPKLREITGAKLIGSKFANEWYAGISGFITWLVDIYLTIYVAKKKRRRIHNVFFPRKISYDFFLEEISHFPNFPDWECISAKGHTHCDFNFYHSLSKSIYIGDNIIKLRNRIIAPYPRVLPQDYKKTLNMYLNMDIKNFLLAHDGIQQINNSEIEGLILNTSDKKRNHKNSTKRILRTIFQRKTKS